MDPALDPTAPESPPRRRGFFRGVTYALSGLASAVVALPFVGYILGEKRRPEDWVDLGLVGDFREGETRLVTFDNPIRQPWDGMVAHTGVYVRRESGEDKFLIFAVNCAHLGCPVEWFPQSGLFMCPCHGGAYYADGERASGPHRRVDYSPACLASPRRQARSPGPHYPTLQDTEKQSA